MARASRAGKFRSALAALPVLLWFASSVAQAAEFVVLDQLAPDQVTEDLNLLIDGEPAGGFHLAAGHATDLLRVNAPGEGPHDYVLCGETVVRLPDGDQQTMPVNDSGELTDADGRVYAAYTAAYRAFFLRDVTQGRPPAELRIHLGPRCPAAISWLDPDATAARF